MKRLLILAAAIGLASIAWAETYNLSTITTDTVIPSGRQTLTGTLAANCKISLADQAIVTLSNVKIEGSTIYNSRWAGLTCEGNATIILEGKNIIRGFYTSYPGIYVPVNSKLTIEGTGTLTASSNGYGAGIGGGFDLDCGSIYVKGGTLFAYGGSGSAGIGGGTNAKCSDISISGGDITATGGASAPGIGSGGAGSCGRIVITGGYMDCTGGENSAGIGCGGTASAVAPASCAEVYISGGTVKSKGGSSGAGIGSGRWSDCGMITVVGGSVTASSSSTAAIGAGTSGMCGCVLIGPDITVVKATSSDGAGLAIGKGSGSICRLVSIDDNLLVSDSGDTRTLTYKIVKLGELTGDKTVGDGMIITGRLSGNYKVSIAAGATVTLRDITISGEDSSDYVWAGLTCLGDATFILEGVNKVTGFHSNCPGVFVPTGKTLWIRGEGTLRAFSNGWAAGIGAGYRQPSCGNITIEGGTIVASGGTGAAGIGSSYGSACGDISILGGEVYGIGGEAAAGIGCGAEGSCGAINIIDRGIGIIEAQGGEAMYSYSAGQPIGLSGYSGSSCGSIYIDPTLIDESVGSLRRRLKPNKIDLGSLSGSYEASDGDVMVGDTSYTVTIPSGATVKINGVQVAGAEGGTVLPSPAFAADGDAATTKFVKGTDGNWTLTAFAELGNDALGKDVTDGQIKVYSADTLEGLATASPMTSGVAIEEKTSAVKTTIKVTPSSGSQSQFFRVKFGE